MFKPNTVLIVGAGASAEVGLPIGTGLVDYIAGLVTIERNELTGTLPQHKPFVRDLMNYAGSEKVPWRGDDRLTEAFERNGGSWHTSLAAIF
jgi:hypothetical protein